VAPLRGALETARAIADARLRAELDRRRADRSLRRVAALAERAALGTRAIPDGDDPQIATSRVVDRAPAVIWRAYADLLDHRVRPEIADPAAIHRMRLSAKKLRYTLEAFDDAFTRDFSKRIEQVTAVQDSAGEMHDAVNAAERARRLLADDRLRPAERGAIERFASDQDTRAAALRPRIARGLTLLRGVAFREDLGRVVVSMG
jgi:CHAD domain-containing protein